MKLQSNSQTLITLKQSLGRKGIAAVDVLAMLLASTGAVVATSTDNEARDNTAKPNNWRLNAENAAVFFENRLQLVNDKLAAVQAKLAAAPENQPGRQAAQRQIDLAIEFRDNAVQAYNSGDDDKATKLLRVAWVHLRNADKILNHGTLLEERKGQKEQWKQLEQEYKDNVKDLRDTYRQALNQLKEQWQQQRQEFQKNKPAGK